MASGDQSKRKCFTLIWKVENVSYWWYSRIKNIVSPEFTIDEISESKWSLYLSFSRNKHSGSSLGLWSRIDKNNSERVKIDFELSFIALDGTALYSHHFKDSEYIDDDINGSDEFPSRYDVFLARRSLFLKENTLTVRCRIRKSVGEISKNVQCFARTRLAVEKSSVLWNIENFSELEWHDTKSGEIKSSSGEQLMKLQLCVTGGQIVDETIHLKIVPNYEIIKTATLQISVVDAYNNTEKFLIGEFSEIYGSESKEVTPYITTEELLKKKNTHLPNNVLSLLCSCTFASGKSEYEIEFGNSNCQLDDKTNELSTATNILINDLKSMLNNNELSDVKLKTRNTTFPAHKVILSLRSPVFKAMFSIDMKENNKDCGDIDDLSDETVKDMLRYIYSADVDELDWGKATELYEAADKYQILDLKDICSSFLKNNLCPNNACEALVLADLHQDADLKRFVQDFILEVGEEIVDSEEWEKLMEAHLKLAAETMRLKFKKWTK